MRILRRIALLASLTQALAAQTIREENLGPPSVLPSRSDRIANYTMEVKLDPAKKTVSGWLILDWRNTSERELGEFWFHAYLNAFQNNKSTHMIEGKGEPLRKVMKEDDWGYLNIRSIRLLADDYFQEADLTGTLRYVQPDDGNKEDRTVFKISTSQPLPPGRSVRFRIEFVSKLPIGMQRTGWAKDYYFMAQWFPKIGVFWRGAWNAHQYHFRTEYFADYGVYDVKMTVPSRYVLGATGKRVGKQDHGDGTTTYHHYQEDVHDFAWVASPRFLEKRDRFDHPGLRPVDVTLLVLPEHEHLTERYLRAVKHAIRFFGEWFGPYPYDILTLVDPAHNSDTGGMEYPTFITGRAHIWSPEKVLSPEGVTVHEFGHQFWYGLVGNNEFEEPWLDEGINSYSEARVQKFAYEPSRWMQRYFGGIPLTFDEVKIPFETSAVPRLRPLGKRDVMARPGWMYLDSYVVNSYDKPELVFWTLERLLGSEVWMKALRVYQHRYRFKHSTTADFIATVNEVVGRDMAWFFQETFYSSDVVDYAVERLSSRAVPQPRGFFDEKGKRALKKVDEKKKDQPPYETEVVVQRLEGARLPVDVEVGFENGEKIRERWDGQYRWVRYAYVKPAKARYAVVDPDRKIVLDVNYTNNSRLLRENSGETSLAAKKWASKWMFWVQHLLEIFAFFS